MADFLEQTGPGPDVGKDPNRPNVLLICCDHLRADWLSCNGHPVVMTPQIDKLAYAGINFRGAFSECPVCVPARRILMTGLNPYNIHMRENRDAQPFTEGPKLAEMFTKAGYQTFAAGKLHVHPQRNRIGFEDVQLNEEGRRQGGLHRDDYEADLERHNVLQLAHSHGLGNNQYGMRLSPLPEPLKTTHWTAQKSMEFLKRRDPTRPFFLYTSFDKPHPPITPPRDYYELYRDAGFPAPARGAWLDKKLTSRTRSQRNSHSYEDWQSHPLMTVQSQRGFAATITHIDSTIGNIIGTLREQGLYQNTWIIFISDHGDQMFDHGSFAKGDFFRGSTNVPFIIQPSDHWRDAKGMQTGRADSAPVGLMDIMPTLLEACGIDRPASLDGVSLVPRIAHPSADVRDHICGVCASLYGVSDGRYSYQWFSDEDIEFLFDHQTDPSECNDLCDSPAHRQVLERCRNWLGEWMRANGDEQFKDGARIARPRNWRLERGKAANPWNNRGLH